MGIRWRNNRCNGLVPDTGGWALLSEKVGVPMDYKEDLKTWCPELTDEHAGLIASAFNAINRERVEAKYENKELKREREHQYQKLVELETQLRANSIGKRLAALEAEYKRGRDSSERAL